MRIAVFLCLFFCQIAFASDAQWLALLHDKGSGSSVVPGKFFLSPTGHMDAESELQATKEYFATHSDAACRFPARAIYLGVKEEGKGSELCERWQKWREAINATGAELVFAAAFLSSPSSMYGHTLLKFVRGGKTSGEDLLDYTLNYGAKTGTVGGLPYVWFGLTGGFDGSYTTAPFYLKVKEYNFVENRDFWIYPLKLSESQVRLLVAHAWEIREMDFPYFFLRRNCAFYLLELLEILKPGAKLTSHFPFWTVPVDTIRLLNNEGWLGTPKFRASRYRRLKEYRAQLQPGERELVESLAENGEGNLPAGREALLLDAGYELYRYRREEKSTENNSVEEKLLARRARYPEKFSPDFSHERSPELGHPSSRLGLNYGQNRSRAFGELQYRGTLHDLLANPHGYEGFSELSMGDLRFRLEGKKIFAERIDVLRLRSVAPSETWIPRNAWSLRIGVGRAKEYKCEAWGCFRYGMEFGYGKSLSAGPLVFYSLLEGKVEGGSVFDRGWRLGLGPVGGVTANPWSGGRVLVEGDWRWRLLGSHLPERAARFGFSQELSRLWELRLQGEVLRAYREGSFGVFHYF